ncbi:MAG: PleD family two-component system response regulator [Rhodospirillales bacterium]|jgi:two-component system cell cycle response regulator|nr:PleD family two-component system response regulator [Rhodospirillales bacterium]MBT5075709.1 PleD family two-component system response regulator [Rhodospirillales bacterium]MBT5113209.1 PleD family two-component system response regulator [Rhodospirillales bacterium]MBT5671842.1 PleD family two-component system response regulator [Rhodospirillales bacterium]MBT6186699.1 PleD family two-component system response regulator [Rhodospirillales bacterium]
MTARVLIVDDLATNLKVLEAKLIAEYYTVMMAECGADALACAVSDSPDIILLDVMMPEMDGFETCRRLKANPETAHIPVVMITALSGTDDRVKGIEAGADDFLTKPVNDLTLFARVRSLVRMKRAMDEWRLREETCDRFGMMDGDGFAIDDASPGNVLVLEPDVYVGERLQDMLSSDGHSVVCKETAADAVESLDGAAFDIILASRHLDEDDGLRFCSHLRTIEKYRTLPILLIIDEEEVSDLVKGFELGVNDYLIRPIDANEVKARVRSQLKQKRYRERLRENYQRSLSMALTDDLTGLYNHRYLCAHLDTALADAVNSGKPLSILMLDIDFFKKVNDTYGHAAGDRVLKEIANCMVLNLREFDTAARLGGEEFVIIMPECSRQVSLKVAERLRSVIEGYPFTGAQEGEHISVTVSIGLSVVEKDSITGEALMARTDQALYAAKRAGRNQVVESSDDLEMTSNAARG